VLHLNQWQSGRTIDAAEIEDYSSLSSHSQLHRVLHLNCNLVEEVRIIVTVVKRQAAL
jgi:hypothetical protein